MADYRMCDICHVNYAKKDPGWDRRTSLLWYFHRFIETRSTRWENLFTRAKLEERTEAQWVDLVSCLIGHTDAVNLDQCIMYLQRFIQDVYDNPGDEEIYNAPGEDIGFAKTAISRLEDAIAELKKKPAKREAAKIEARSGPLVRTKRTSPKMCEVCGLQTYPKENDPRQEYVISEAIHYFMDSSLAHAFGQMDPSLVGLTKDEWHTIWLCIDRHWKTIDLYLLQIGAETFKTRIKQKPTSTQKLDYEYITVFINALKEKKRIYSLEFEAEWNQRIEENPIQHPAKSKHYK